MSEQRKHIEVVAAIIKKGNTILATQRGYGDLKDGWEFPGGKVESGEAHEVALKREIQEELEAEIDVQEHIITVENDSDITLLEHEAAKWLSKDTLYTVDWLPADIEAVDAIYKRL